MTALYIILGVAALITFVLLLRVKIYIILNSDESDSQVSSYAKILFYKRVLAPEQPEKIKLSDFTAEKFKSYIENDKAKINETTKSTKSTVSEGSSLFKELEEIKFILSRLINGAAKQLRCEILDFNIKVGTSDVVTTALLYPVVCTAVEGIFNYIDNAIDFRRNKTKRMCITPDYVNTEIKADVNIVFSMTVFGIITTLGDIVVRYTKHMIEEENKKNYKRERNDSHGRKQIQR